MPGVAQHAACCKTCRVLHGHMRRSGHWMRQLHWSLALEHLPPSTGVPTPDAGLVTGTCIVVGVSHAIQEATTGGCDPRSLSIAPAAGGSTPTPTRRDARAARASFRVCVTGCRNQGEVLDPGAVTHAHTHTALHPPLAGWRTPLRCAPGGSQPRRWRRRQRLPTAAGSHTGGCAPGSLRTARVGRRHPEPSAAWPMGNGGWGQGG